MGKNHHDGLTWQQIKKQLYDNARLSELKLKLEKRSPINMEEIVLINLFIQDDFCNASKEFSKESLTLARRAVDLSQKTIRWSKILAILTGVLASTALINIILRMLC